MVEENVWSLAKVEESVAGPARLSRFHVKQLFGEFDHTIDLNLESRITAVIAPNGSGKTVCLRLINAFFRRQWSTFSTTQYDCIEYDFADGKRVRIIKTENLEPEDDNSSVGITLAVSCPGEETVHWVPRLQDEQRTRISQVERYLPFVTRVGTNRWTHDHTAQSYTLHELLQTFREHLPMSLRSGLYPGEPKSLKSLIDLIDCHLIETQRPLIIPEGDRYSDRRAAAVRDQRH